MKDKLISVIVPIYNGRKHVANIFDNIDRQKYRNLEVLLIDDESHDDSVKAIKSEIEERVEGSVQGLENGIKASDGIEYRLIKKHHKGQGAIRNFGIEEARGEYLIFIDQDDYIRRDYIEKLYEVAERDNSDIVISGYAHVEMSGKVIENVKLTNNEWCRFMNITPWGKIYRRSFIMDNNIRFLPTPLGEDVYFNLHCYVCTKKVSYTEYIGYKWLLNDASLSNTLHKRYDERINVIELFTALINIKGSDVWMKDEQYEYFFLKTGIYHILFIAGGTNSRDLILYKRAVIKWLKKNMPGIRDNELIALYRPEGERMWVRATVYLFMLLYRLKLDELFLKIFHVVRRIR